MARPLGESAAELKAEAVVPDAPTATDANGVADQDGGLDPVAVDAAEQRAVKVMEGGAQVKADVEDLGDLVKRCRFARLHAYAMRSGWAVNDPPLGGDPEAQGWWQEWRELRDQDRQQRAAMSSVPPQESGAAAPPAPPPPESKASAP